MNTTRRLVCGPRIVSLVSWIVNYRIRIVNASVWTVTHGSDSITLDLARKQ